LFDTVRVAVFDLVAECDSSNSLDLNFIQSMTIDRA